MAEPKLLVCTITAISILYMLSKRGKKKCPIQQLKDLEEKNIDSLNLQEIPIEFQYHFYFDFDAHPFQHVKIFQNALHIFEVLRRIHSYTQEWLDDYVLTHSSKSQVITMIPGGSNPFLYFGNGECQIVLQDSELAKDISLEKVIRKVEINSFPNTEIPKLIICKNATIAGGVFDLSKGSIYVGENVTIDPGVYIAGPTIIGKDSIIKFGAYLRGDILIGESVTIRGELKNVLIMDESLFCHPGYCGDSICGFRSHFGNQATSSNLSLTSWVSHCDFIKIKIMNVVYDTNLKKIGVVIGDFSQLGCNAVTDPGTLISMNTHVYPLTRLNKGIYGPNEIIKNKPLEKEVVQRVKMY